MHKKHNPSKSQDSFNEFWDNFIQILVEIHVLTKPNNMKLSRFIDETNLHEITTQNTPKIQHYSLCSLDFATNPN